MIFRASALTPDLFFESPKATDYVAQVDLTPDRKPAFARQVH
jgi:hypothetical protein